MAYGSLREGSVDNIFSMLENKGIEFTDQQRKAIIHKDGPAFIVAIPGSGKTTVSVCRSANLILNYGVNPKNILSVTFSRASAMDMQNRLVELFGGLIPEGITFSTIHSFAYTVIREHSRITGKQYTVIEDDKARVNKALLLKGIYYNINKGSLSDDSFEELTNSIGLVKNMMIHEADFKLFEFGIPNFKDIYNAYEKYKQEHGYIDYDDMLTRAYEILKSNENLLERCRRQYQYIQVDEGQDTSRIQHEIINLLAYPRNNIFIVADDDQSIYAFRGADPEQLLNIGRRYKGTKVYKIDRNFRSTKSIVSAANKFIKLNKRRIDKNLQTGNEDGSPVRIIGLNNDMEQADYIIKEIKCVENLSNYAVLFRNNISSIPVADALARNNIGFYIKDFKQNFFKHWIVQDITAFLNLSIDSTDIASFERIYYKLNCYLSKQMLEFVRKSNTGRQVFETLKSFPELSPFHIKRITELASDFESFREMTPYNVLIYIERAISYREYIEDYCRKFGYSIKSADAVLANLKSIAKGTDNIKDYLSRIDTLQNIIDSSKHNKYKNAVTLSTIHSAKGLEFETVFMIDLIDEEFPNYQSLKKFYEGEERYLEEERRLFYVGMTRAKKNLNVITINSRNRIAVDRSRFVDELENILNPKSNNTFDDIQAPLEKKPNPKKEVIQGTEVDYKSLRQGISVRHAKLGTGKVESISREEDNIEIYFEGESKKLSLSFCMKNHMLYLPEERR